MNEKSNLHGASCILTVANTSTVYIKVVGASTWTLETSNINKVMVGRSTEHRLNILTKRLFFLTERLFLQGAVCS